MHEDEMVTWVLYSRVPSLRMKQVNSVLVSLVFAEVSVKIGQCSDSVTEQSQVLQRNLVERLLKRQLCGTGLT